MQLSKIDISGHVAIVVTNPQVADNPIVKCNSSFLTLTGYSETEVIGHNCRFLVGPATEAEEIAKLRQAVRDARPVVAELTNYKRDGTPFLNSVMIAPIFDDDGTLVWFIGSQTPISLDNPVTSSEQVRCAKLQIGRLSLRQRQVLMLLASGKRFKQIAYELGLSERTVKMHRATALKSLEVETNAEAIRKVVEAGL